MTAVPQTQEDANMPTSLRGLVIVGGFLALIPLAPVLYVWAIIGAILVPLVWVSTGRSRKAMMEAAGCATKEEWKAFVAQLPTKKQLKQANDGNAPAGAPGTALAAIAHAERSPSSSSSSREAQSPKRFVSPHRPELKFPQYRLLSPNFANVEVVGESFRESSVIAALGGLTRDVEKTMDDVSTFLVPEPENPHGKGKAVMIWMNGHHVGYLSAEDATRYQPLLSRIVSFGYLPTTTGRIWGVQRIDWEGKTRNHLYARVALNEPDLLTPTNNPPRGNYSLLPWGPAIQVTKESEHLPELTEHLNGPDSFALATMRPAARTLKNGAVREYVTVHLDGDEIGELTPNMSEKVLPAIRHLNDLDYEAAGWARVKGSPLAIEVTLQVAKAHEIPESWLEQVPVTVPRLHEDRNPRAGETPGDLTAQGREANWDF